MLDVFLAAGLGASLVAVSTAAAAPWGHVIGGVLSAFPLIVGPVLLVAAERHGTAFAARTAAATLLGLIALSGFALAYARAASGGGPAWRPLGWWRPCRARSPRGSRRASPAGSWPPRARSPSR